MRFRLLFLGLFFLMSVLPGLLSAAGSDFTMTVFIGSDTTPPTTPVLLSVIPVAATQIDVAWSAATDDVVVAGYRVFRDAVQIATTTLLMYSDTGLTASTTYSYTVDAFDSFYNYSSSSSAVATTTLANPPPIATSTPTSSASTQSSTRVNPALSNLIITTTQAGATFTWQTTGPTQYTLVWGRTTSYELGAVSGTIFNVDHKTTITNLEPGTNYYYELKAITNRGGVSVLSASAFTTQSLVSPTILPNVRAFTATAEKNNVVLNWNNTFTQPNYFVRIVRSHLFYPSTIQSGAVVYEGRSQSFTDNDALAYRSPQYYTIFVLDGTGAVSGGAVAAVFRVGTKPGTGPQTATSTSGNSPSVPDEDSGDETVLRASDISIVGQARAQVFDTDLVLDYNESYVVRIPATAVPKNLKSIIVSVQNPSDQRIVSAYLLKLNQAGDAYEASIPAPGIVGNVRMMVEVFDYEQATVRRISRSVAFVNNNLPIPFFPDLIMLYAPYLLVLVMAVVSLLWFLIAWKNRRRQT